MKYPFKGDKLLVLGVTATSMHFWEVLRFVSWHLSKRTFMHKK